MKVIWIVLAVALFIGFVYDRAYSAGRTDQEIPLSATETARDARQAKTPCTRQRVLILAQRLPNGKAIPVMVAVVTVPC